MKKQVFLSKNAVQTQKLAGQLAEEISLQKSTQKAVILALEGELGGGKTTFVQGLAQALGVKEWILSPTFVILKRFTIHDSRFKNLYHVDCYRLDDPKDLTDLGFNEIIKDPKNLIVIEWADKVKKIIPKNAVWLKFKWISQNQRKISKF